MGRSNTVVIIPAFNEQNTISNVIYSAKQYADVIVVNDASTDKTSEISRSAGAIVIDFPKNMGYDFALNEGFRKAKDLSYEFAITIDADGQHDPKLINIFAEELKFYDLILGYRSKKQRAAEYLYDFFTNYLYEWKDPLCGMKGYSMKLFLDLGYFDSVNSIGTELAMYGIVSNYKYKQILIPIYPRQDKPRFHSSIVANIKIFIAMIKILNKYRVRN